MRFDVLGLVGWPYGYEAYVWEGQNSDFEESCIVLTHFRVLLGGRPNPGKTNQLVHRALAREGFLAILASWLVAGLPM